MNYIIAGLGNPGEEYINSRHNVGRMFVEYLRKKEGFLEWREDKKLKAATSEGKIGKGKVLLVEPNNFMNNSGKSLLPLVKNKKQAEQLVIIYDDLDLPLGTLKISFNRGSGGHRG
ncbi:MAG: aminoacyl-tRNA hydrolase, partial [Patescibacteria group bacterium]